jgi:hypothetical protein
VSGNLAPNERCMRRFREVILGINFGMSWGVEGFCTMSFAKS